MAKIRGSRRMKTKYARLSDIIPPSIKAVLAQLENKRLPDSMGECAASHLLAQPVPVREWDRASKPRCVACGGLLDRTGWWTEKK